MQISASVRMELIEDLLTYETSIKTDIFLSLGNVEVLNLEKKNVKLQIGETLTDNLGFGCSCIARLPSSAQREQLRINCITYHVIEERKQR